MLENGSHGWGYEDMTEDNDDLMGALRDLYENGSKLDKDKLELPTGESQPEGTAPEEEIFSEEDLLKLENPSAPGSEGPDMSEIRDMKELMEQESSSSAMESAQDVTEEFVEEPFDFAAMMEAEPQPDASEPPEPVLGDVAVEDMTADKKREPEIISAAATRPTVVMDSNVIPADEESQSVDDALADFAEIPSQEAVETRFLKPEERSSLVGLDSESSNLHRRTESLSRSDDAFATPVTAENGMGSMSHMPPPSSRSGVGDAVSAALFKHKGAQSAKESVDMEAKQFFASIPSIEKFNLAFEVNERSQIAEEFRILRARLAQYKFPPKKPSIMLTSCHHGEGKTSTGLNLSLFLAKSPKKKILLIDCDLRRPRVDFQLGIKTEYDIADVITGKVTLEQAIVYSQEHNLYALTAKKDYANASELLESEEMRNMIDRVHRLFDFVVFDTCPILSTADPTIIGPKVGGVLLIIQTRKTQRESIYHASDLLKDAGANLLGAVLTYVKFDMPKYFYRYQYYHSYYYYNSR